MNDYNIEFEKSILSSLIFSPSQVDGISSILNSKDFYLPSHSNIYDVIVDLDKKSMPIDEDFIKQEMIRRNNFDEDVMLSVMFKSPIANISNYVDQIIDMSNKRKIFSLGIYLQNDIPMDEKIDAIKTSVSDIENSGVEVESFSGEDIVSMEFENKVSYEVGLTPIDLKIGGLQRSQMIFVTGAEETGKTHITYKMMENLSQAHKVGIISLEFGKRKLKDRLNSMIRRGNKINLSNIRASFESHSINKIEKMIRKWANEGVGFVVLDSFNLVENDKSSDSTQNIIDTGKRLFKLTQQLDILLIAISTSTKADHKDGNPSIYGGQLLNHYCDQKWHIMRDLETEERILWVNKNKQNYEYFQSIMIFEKNGDISFPEFGPTFNPPHEIEYQSEKIEATVI